MEVIIDARRETLIGRARGRTIWRCFEEPRIIFIARVEDVIELRFDFNFVFEQFARGENLIDVGVGVGVSGIDVSGEDSIEARSKVLSGVNDSEYFFSDDLILFEFIFRVIDIVVEHDLVDHSVIEAVDNQIAFRVEIGVVHRFDSGEDFIELAK